MRMLKQQAKYDVDHALVLCKMYKFEKGVVYLYEKLKLFNEIVQHYMEAKNHAQIIKAAKNTVPMILIYGFKHYPILPMRKTCVRKK